MTLHEAVLRHDLETLKRLIGAGADKEARNESGETALHIAASMSSGTECVLALLSAGTDVDARDNRDKTALHVACETKAVATISNLLAAGADMEARQWQGWTPLHCAAYMGYVESISALIKAGANRSVTTPTGLTPLNFAQKAGDSAEVLRLLGGTSDVSVRAADARENVESSRRPVALTRRPLVKTGGKLVKHARSSWLMLADSHLARRLFGSVVRRVEGSGFVKLISVRSMKGSVSKVGSKYRYQVRVEGENESNCGLGWSGVTINVPSINSREQYSVTEIQMSSVGGSAPFQHGPGDMIFGFRDDGSFGEKAASCLFMESVREQWPPHEPIALEAVLITRRKSLDFQVRVWSNRPENGGAFGDPDWKTTQRQKDQQGIPAYAISVRFHLLSAVKNLLRGLFGATLKRASATRARL